MLDSFYRKNYPIVYGYLLSLCGNAHQAEEIAAETFAIAVEKIHTYNPNYSASTWLCTIAKNLYINQWKRKQRFVPIPDDLPCTSPSPEDLYIQKEQARRAISAAEKLPLIQRQVVFMRWEGMSFSDIALALGKSENWARVTYFRAKSKVLSEMEDAV